MIRFVALTRKNIYINGIGSVHSSTYCVQIWNGSRTWPKLLIYMFLVSEGFLCLTFRVVVGFYFEARDWMTEMQGVINWFGPHREDICPNVPLNLYIITQCFGTNMVDICIYSYALNTLFIDSFCFSLFLLQLSLLLFCLFFFLFPFQSPLCLLVPLCAS